MKLYKDEVQVGILKLFPDVNIPEYRHEGDACADVRAHNIVKLIRNDVKTDISGDFSEITIYPGDRVRIGTGFKLDVPDGWCVNIEGRSGFSFDEGIIVTNAPGKAECIYKGEYMVNLMKVCGDPTVIRKNDRIAQMEIVPQIKMLFHETDSVSIEEGNERGENGLGSSGVK